MSSWGRSFWVSNRPRLSPFGSRTDLPSVTKDDFSYITSGELTSSGQVYDPAGQLDSSSKQVEDDILLIKSQGAVYPVKFPAYSIDDGKLLVRDVKERAIAAMDLPVGSERDIKLLYKGQQLKDDFKPCQDYNIKNQSEIFCKVTQPSINPGESDDGSESVESTRMKRIRGRIGKKPHMKRKTSNLSRSDNTTNSRSVTPSIPEIQGPIEKLATIATHFHTKILPLCMQFTAQPPEDQKKKDFEHKKLSETTMNEVLLKLDAVETVGDNDAREKRRALVREVQGVLSGLDEAVRK